MFHRDQGLIRGIGAAALSASIVNIVIGAGIFSLPAAVARHAGPWAPAAYGVCAIIMAGITLCFAEAGARVPTSGGAYGTVEAAFGPACGFVTGMLLVLSDLLASGGVAAALADLAASVAPSLRSGIGRSGFILVLYTVLALANLVGVSITMRLITGATLFKLLPLLLFIALGLATIGLPPPPGPPLGSPTGQVSLQGLGRALILTLFAFEGMETALGASGEVRNPARTLPLALLRAMAFILAIYVGVQLTAQHLLGGQLAQATAPLAQAAGRVSPLARLVLLGAAGISMLSWMASDILGTSRMIFALARDRLLPVWLGGLHPRTHVPARAICLYAAAGAVLAITGSFLELVFLSSLATVAIYILVCGAALRLRQQGVAQAGPPPRLPALPLAAGIGLAGMALMLATARWQELAGLAAAIGLSLGLYLLTLRRR